MRKVLASVPTLAVLLVVSQFSGFLPFLSASTQAQEKAAASPAMEVKIGLGIEKLELTGAADSFKIAPGTKIFAWTRVKGVPAGSAVSIVFKKGDRQVFTKEFSIASIPYRINAYRTFRAGDAGDWTAVVTGSEGKELASSAFKVEITK
jgi:hypothetical protein